MTIVKFIIKSMIRLTKYTPDLLSIIPLIVMYHIQYRKTNDTLNITLATNDFITGGIERVLVDSYNILVSRGYNVNFVLINQPTSEDIVIPKEAHIDVLGYKALTDQLCSLMKYILRNKPDIIYAAGPYMIPFASIIKIVLFGRVRLIARLDTDYRIRLERLNPNHLYHKVLKFTLCCIWIPNRVIINEESLMEDSQKLSIFRSRMVYLRNPVDLERIERLSWEYSDHPWLDGNFDVVLLVGRLVLTKNVDMILRVFALISKQRKRARLIVVGDGELREDLEAQAIELGISDCVSFVGNIPNPYNIMRRSKVLAVTSYLEAGPLVAIEAMACGLPVVLTDYPTAYDVLDNGKFGEIVGINDDEAMCNALIRSMDSPPDPSLLVEASRRYSIENHANGLCQIITDVRGKHGT